MGGSNGSPTERPGADRLEPPRAWIPGREDTLTAGPWTLTTTHPIYKRFSLSRSLLPGSQEFIDSLTETGLQVKLAGRFALAVAMDAMNPANITDTIQAIKKHTGIRYEYMPRSTLQTAEDTAQAVMRFHPYDISAAQLDELAREADDFVAEHNPRLKLEKSILNSDAGRYLTLAVSGVASGIAQSAIEFFTDTYYIHFKPDNRRSSPPDTL